MGGNIHIIAMNGRGSFKFETPILNTRAAARFGDEDKQETETPISRSLHANEINS